MARSLSATQARRRSWARRRVKPAGGEQPAKLPNRALPKARPPCDPAGDTTEVSTSATTSRHARSSCSPSGLSVPSEQRIPARQRSATTESARRAVSDWTPVIGGATIAAAPVVRGRSGSSASSAAPPWESRGHPPAHSSSHSSCLIHPEPRERAALARPYSSRVRGQHVAARCFLSTSGLCGFRVADRADSLLLSPEAVA